MNSNFRTSSHWAFLLISLATLVISIPLFLISKSSLIFLSTAAISITTACVIYPADVFDFKIERIHYPVIASIYFVDIFPIFDAFGIDGGYKSQHLNFPQTTEWYAATWMKLLLVFGILIIGHSMVKWFNRSRFA